MDFDYLKSVNSFIKSHTPNEPIDFPIPTNNFILKFEGDNLNIKGFLRFEWMPNMMNTFHGEVVYNENSQALFSERKWEIFIEGKQIGIIDLIQAGLNFEGTKVILIGKFNKPPIFGNITESVNKLSFTIPNLSPLFKTHATFQSKDDIERFYENRTVFENLEFTIIIDELFEKSSQEEALKKQGGYAITHVGEIRFKKDAGISYDDVTDIANCLSKFLTLINGRKTATVFLQGFKNDELVWSNFSPNLVDQYNFVRSWVPKMYFQSLNEIWWEFYNLWKNANAKSFLTSAVFWYAESNYTSTLRETRIIVAQAALELIFNWAKECKIISSGRVNAASKIRALCLYTNILFNQEFLPNLSQYKNETDLYDFPVVLTELRNLLTHTKNNDHLKIKSIRSEVFSEGLNLALYIIEMSLLRILNYNGKVNNRTLIQLDFYDREQSAPWLNLP